MNTQIVDASYVLENLGKLPVVDLRPEFAYASSHVPGAANFDYWAHKAEDEFALPDRLAASLEELGVGLSDPVVIMCQRGVTSTEACGLLEDHGYTELRHYIGGFLDWKSDESRPWE